MTCLLPWFSWVGIFWKLSSSFQSLIATFRLDNDCEVEYEYDVSICACCLQCRSHSTLLRWTATCRNIGSECVAVLKFEVVLVLSLVLVA